MYKRTIHHYNQGINDFDLIGEWKDEPACIEVEPNVGWIHVFCIFKNKEGQYEDYTIFYDLFSGKFTKSTDGKKYSNLTKKMKYPDKIYVNGVSFSADGRGLEYIRADIVEEMKRKSLRLKLRRKQRI